MKYDLTHPVFCYCEAHNQKNQIILSVHHEHKTKRIFQANTHSINRLVRIQVKATAPPQTLSQCGKGCLTHAFHNLPCPTIEYRNNLCTAQDMNNKIHLIYASQRKRSRGCSKSPLLLTVHLKRPEEYNPSFTSAS